MPRVAGLDLAGRPADLQRGPFERIGLETSVPLLVSFVLVCLAEVVVGVMLLLGVPHAATTSYLLLPFEFAFGIGFALSFARH